MDAQKGLFVNSTDLCKAKHRAKANATAQNGKRDRSKPLVRAQCGKAHRKRHAKHRHRAKRGGGGRSR